MQRFSYETQDLKQKIAELPKGYISRKVIKGRDYYYHQWKEDGKLKSRYLRPQEKQELELLIERRKNLQQQLKEQQERVKFYASKLYLKAHVPIGVQDFETLISETLFYVDKTGLIAEWWEKKDSVTLICRPRRFGKTLNMSMMNAFFSNQFSGRYDLFRDFEIWEKAKYRELQGTYPTIFITLSNAKQNTYEKMLPMFNNVIMDVYHQYILNIGEENLTEEERKYCGEIHSHMSEETAIYSIYRLSEMMYQRYEKKVLIFMDEYDSPVLESYVNGFFQPMMRFLRMFFNTTFKVNPYMEKALLTGITRVSKESFFSDMNHVNVISTTTNEYASYFGFTEEEVFESMDRQGLTEKQEVKKWYDGFTFGTYTDIYNPWSIINYLRQKELKPFWVNTSGNQIVSQVFQTGDEKVKETLMNLIDGASFWTRMDEAIDFSALDHEQEAKWSLLVSGGYLKVIQTKDTSDGKMYELAATNLEVRIMLKNMIHNWFALVQEHYNLFIQAMLESDVDYMNYALSQMAERIFSFFDTSSECREPERFYHGFVLGLLVDLKERYIVTSNRESGLGRYDVALEPRNQGKDPVILMEFKVRRKRTEASLEETVKDALEQIKKKKYAMDFLHRGFQKEKIHAYGVAFEGKQVLIEEERHILL